MEQNKQIKRAGIFIFVGLIVLGCMALLGCYFVGISVSSSAYHDEWLSNVFFGGPLTAQIREISYDYLDETDAAQYCGMDNAGTLWQTLRDSGALDGTYVKFDMPIVEGDKEEIVPVHVYSKAKLDEWMQAQIPSAE